MPDGDKYQIVESSFGMGESGMGLLRLKGSDCLDFLQRLSTNDMNGVNVGEHRTTVLTTEKGRIVDIVTLLRLEDSFILTTSSENSQRVKEWLEKFIVMEDIQIIDVTADFSRYCIVGSKVIAGIQQLGLDLDFDVNKILSLPNGFLFRNPLWKAPYYHLIVRSDLTGKNPPNSVNLNDIPSADPETIEVMRIENGVPQLGKELTDQVNPLEANLEKFVSFTKGCYIGQEVIARLDTYKKLQRKLWGLILGSAVQPLREGQELYLNGNGVGWVTSPGWSYKLDKGIALSYLKIDVSSTHVEYKNDGLPGQDVAQVVDLPF